MVAILFPTIGFGAGVGLQLLVLPEEARRVGRCVSSLDALVTGLSGLHAKTKKVDGIFCQDSNYRAPDLVT